jgi:hypothetical protein
LQVNKLLVTFTDTLIEEVSTSLLNILTAIESTASPEVSSTTPVMDELINYGVPRREIQTLDAQPIKVNTYRK